VFWNDLRDAILTGAGRYDWSSPPHAAADGASPTGDGAGPARQSTAAAPEAGVHPDESQVKEAVHLWLEGAHYIGDTSEVLGYLASAAGAGEESAVVLLGEALGPVGMIASVILVGWETIHAFGTGLRLQEQQGFCYGVMWQACGLSNQHKNFIDWAGDTAGELKEAFYAGVSDGRAKAGDAATHNRVMLVIAYYQASSGDLDWARHRVLNDLWQHVRENNLGRDDLAWPVPESMQL
jgi:hypothetical protein